MVGKHASGPRDQDLNLDDLIKAQQARLTALREELEKCDHQDGPIPRSVPPFVEGAPVLAYSEGAYPAGTNLSDCESGSGSKDVKRKGLKRSLTRIPSPAKSDKRGKVVETFPQDAQDPNGTPQRGSQTPVFSPAPSAPATPAAAPATPTPVAPASMPPPPVPTGPEQKDALFWKLRRQCVIKSSTVSEDALKLWKTRDGRSKLREMMLKHNMDFSMVEMDLKKSKTVSLAQKRTGQWVTKHYLLTTMAWTKKMADNAFEWASKQNLVRTNEVHQEQEAKLILEEGFSYEEVDKEETTTSTQITVEDESGTALESDLPGNSRLEILQHSSGDDTSLKPEDAAAANSGSFKLVFPTIQENASAVSILPHFIEVCGRKIDNTANVLEKLKGIKAVQAVEMGEQIQIQLNHMKDIYGKLEKIQSDCAVTRSARPEMQQEILRLFANCTKTDVALNNLVVRARTIKAPASSRPKTTKPAATKSSAKPKAAKSKK